MLFSSLVSPFSYVHFATFPSIVKLILSQVVIYVFQGVRCTARDPAQLTSPVSWARGYGVEGGHDAYDYHLRPRAPRGRVLSDGTRAVQKQAGTGSWRHFCLGGGV